MERRQFTREFKLEAVRLVRERGVAVKHVNQRRGQAASGNDSNDVKAIKKIRSGWGHDRRRS